ncbi:uncharacterized protein [Ptychodera flava]|uniref:uncharacterized protein n=1 Tax=Ptychodera flava TaxID=63121 RepID=UPI00396A0981
MAGFMAEMRGEYVEAIQAVMAEYDVDPVSVPSKYRYQSVHGRCRSGCRRCKKSWGSHLGWLTIDFRRQCVAKFWRQKCRGCKDSKIMIFDDSTKIRMIEIALIRLVRFMTGEHQLETGDEGDYDPPIDNGEDEEDDDEPHERMLCEKCRWGRQRCRRRRR